MAHYQDEQLHLSASDLVGFLNCGHLAGLEVALDAECLEVIHEQASRAKILIAR